MPYYLSKVLPLLLLPISLSLIAALLTLVFIIKGKRAWSLVSLLTSILVLWVAALPEVAGRLLWSLERQYVPVPTAEIPTADCIVVLGGALGAAIYPRVEIELTDSSDRVYQAAKLYRKGKAKTVIVAAGNQPWNKGREPEARLIGELLVEWGVLRSSIVLDTESKNTRENAINAAAALQANGCESNLLVTSGWHMPRAIAAFKRVGVEMIPVSVDVGFVEGDSALFTSVASFIPTADALATTSSAIKEWMGIWVYRWRGWA
jgi:uncharacterized SAM-binding protein YcdF (DUF218 family)